MPESTVVARAPCMGGRYPKMPAARWRNFVHQPRAYIVRLRSYRKKIGGNVTRPRASARARPSMTVLAPQTVRGLVPSIAGRIEERDGKLYATQSTEHAAV